MTTNQASGGLSVRVARSHGRRQSAAETRATAATEWSSRTAAEVMEPVRSPGDLRPGRHPLLERHTVVLAVAALGQRRLPELQRLEVRLGGVGVVVGARPFLDLVHDRAGELVRRGLPEVVRLLRLDPWRGYPLHPLVGAVGVGRV